MTPDPNSYTQASVQTLAETLASKNSDYAPTGEFSNFEKAAEVAGTTVIQLIAGQLAIKMTRIQSLMNSEPSQVRNESLRDSFLDAAGYATIGNAWLEWVEDTAAMDAYQEASNEISQAERSWEFDPGLHGQPKVTAERCTHPKWQRTGADMWKCSVCGVRESGENLND